MPKTRILINFGNEVNIMTLAYVEKLGFITQKTSIRAQKIDSMVLDIYDMIMGSFWL